MIPIMDSHLMRDPGGSQLLVEVNTALNNPNMSIMGAIIYNNPLQPQKIILVLGNLLMNITKAAFPSFPGRVIAYEIAIGLAVRIIKVERRLLRFWREGQSICRTEVILHRKCRFQLLIFGLRQNSFLPVEKLAN